MGDAANVSAEGSAPQQAQVLELLAEARRLARMGHRAAARAADAQARALLAEAAALPRWQVQLALVQCSLRFFSDDAEGALAGIRQARALACSHGLQALQAACAAAGALFLQYLDQVHESLAWAEEALRLAAPDDHETRYRAVLSVATLCQQHGDGARAFSLYRTALGHARAVGDSVGSAATMGRMTMVQGREVLSAWVHGRLDVELLKQAIVGLRSALAMAAQEGFPPDGGPEVTLGELLVLAGQHAAASEALTPWSSAERLADAPFMPSRVAALLGQCALAAGEHGAARTWRAQADARWPHTWPEGFALMRALALAQRAQLQQQLGEPAEALQAELQDALRVLGGEQAARREQLQRAIAASALDELVAA